MSRVKRCIRPHAQALSACDFDNKQEVIRLFDAVMSSFKQAGLEANEVNAYLKTVALPDPFLRLVRGNNKLRIERAVESASWTACVDDLRRRFPAAKSDIEQQLIRLLTQSLNTLCCRMDIIQTRPNGKVDAITVIDPDDLQFLVS